MSMVEAIPRKMAPAGQAAVPEGTAVAGEVPPADSVLLREFIADRNELAFQVLVQRHAPLVMGVCRRTLGNEQDAEDAFQATFLVLARKAGSVKRAASLGAWLYQTAYRIALRARSARGRRREELIEGNVMHEMEALSKIADVQEQSVLDEEFHRLPEKYRSVLFLHCVEGLSREDTAEQLGLSPGSVKGRLERGRHLLRQRLMLRGASFSLAMALLSGMQQSAQAAQMVVAPSLIASAVQGGLNYAGGNGTAGLVSQNALSLANGSFQIMSMTTAKMAAGCLLMIGTLTALSWVPAPAAAGGSGSGEVLDSSRLVAPAGGETVLAFAFPGEGEGRRGGGEREGGARRSPEAEAGPRRSAEGDAGPRRGGEGGNRGPNPLQGFRPQTPREAALLQMILQLQREMADLRRAVGQPAGARRDGAVRDGGARDGGPRDGEGRRGGIPDGTVSAAPAGWERTKAGGVFRSYDKNRDQFVSLEEWLAMTNGNISATRRALQTKRFNETRPGTDGKLSPAEFIDWYNNRNGAAPRGRGEGGRAAEGEGRRSPEAEAGPRRSPEADAGPRRSAEGNN